MKKLMIAAAIVCAAVIAQAANINWSITGLKNSSGGTLSTGYVYTFSSKEGTYQTVEALTQALLAATDAAGVEKIADESFFGLNGTVASGSYSTTVVPSASGLTEGTKSTKLFALITDTEEITASTKWYVTEDMSNKVAVPYDTGLTDGNYSIEDVGSATASNWHSIPEPTSGLLLLLGMAGLALRRRRA